jgi:hypothetical protein
VLYKLTRLLLIVASLFSLVLMTGLALGWFGMDRLLLGFRAVLITVGLFSFYHSRSAAIKNKTGQEPDAYALAAYDAVWVIARTVAAFPEPTKDLEKIKQVFQSTAGQFYGITGPLFLNIAGDRSTGSFDYWGIVSQNGTYTWKLVGKSK